MISCGYGNDRALNDKFCQKMYVSPMLNAFCVTHDCLKLDRIKCTVWFTVFHIFESQCIISKTEH